MRNCRGFLGSRVSADASSSQTFRSGGIGLDPAIEPNSRVTRRSRLVSSLSSVRTRSRLSTPNAPSARTRMSARRRSMRVRTTPFNVTCPSSTSTVMTVRRLPLPVQNVGSSSNRSVMSCWKSSSSSSSEIARLACVLIHLSHRVQCPQRIPADSTFGSAVPRAVHLLRRRNRLHGSCQLLFRLSGSASSGFRNATGSIVCPGLAFWSIPVTAGAAVSSDEYLYRLAA